MDDKDAKILNNCKSILIIVSLVVFIRAMSGLSLAEPSVQLRLASFKTGNGWLVMAGLMAEIFKGNLPPGTFEKGGHSRDIVKTPCGSAKSICQTQNLIARFKYLGRR